LRKVNHTSIPPLPFPPLYFCLSRIPIQTRAAFENAMVLIMALGGSTNAVLHLLAMAKACNVPLTIDDFQKVASSVCLFVSTQRHPRLASPAA